MQPISKTMNGISKINTSLISDVIKEYQCEYCGSTVQVLKATILGKEKVIDRCRVCEEITMANEVIELIDQKKHKKLLEIFDNNSLINQDLRNKGFKDYVPSHPTQQEAIEIAKRYVKDFSTDDPKNLLFQGKYGLGKSHLAVAIIKNLMHKGHTTIFVSAPKLLTKLKSTFNKKSEYTEDQMLTALEKADCLVLDDMGAEVLKKDDQGESWALQKMFEIVDSRQGKHTIYTTNLNGEELAKKYNPRNVSRMMMNTEVVKFEGLDHRIKK